MDSDTVSECFLTKLVIKGEIVYLKISWENNEDHLFHIRIISNEKSWSGEYSYTIAKKFAENFDENDEEYKNNVKNALRINNGYTYDFTPVDNEKDTAKFSWKRVFSNSTAIIVHGFVIVKQDETPETKTNVIDFLLNENQILRYSIEEYKIKNGDLARDLDNWKNEFNKLVDIKSSLENTLYAKFIELLNSKKRRIQLLEDHLHSYENIKN